MLLVVKGTLLTIQGIAGLTDLKIANKKLRIVHFAKKIGDLKTIIFLSIK